MEKKTLDEHLQDLQDMLIEWHTRDYIEEIMRVKLQRKVQEIQKYSEGVIKI